MDEKALDEVRFLMAEKKLSTLGKLAQHARDPSPSGKPGKPARARCFRRMT